MQKLELILCFIVTPTAMISKNEIRRAIELQCNHNSNSKRQLYH